MYENGVTSREVAIYPMHLRAASNDGRAEVAASVSGPTGQHVVYDMAGSPSPPRPGHRFVYLEWPQGGTPTYLENWARSPQRAYEFDGDNYVAVWSAATRMAVNKARQGLAREDRAAKRREQEA